MRGVGLPGNAKALQKSHALGNALVELLDLGRVSLEELEEGGLGPGRALHSAEAQGLQPELHLFEVEDEVLKPKCGPLAHGGRLGRLEVGVPQRRQIFVRGGEGGEVRGTPYDPVPDERQGFPVLDQVRVVADEGAGGSEVDNTFCGRSHVTEQVHVGHDVVAEASLVLGGLVEVQVVERLAHLVQSLGWDGQAKLMLRLGQGQPEASPRSEAVGRRK